MTGECQFEAYILLIHLGYLGLILLGNPGLISNFKLKINFVCSIINTVMRGKRIYLKLFLIVALLTAAIFIDMPNGPDLKIGKKQIFKQEIKIKEGLDLQGGARITYEADLSKIDENRKNDAMNSLSKVIENRVNAFGVTEPTVQTAKSGGQYRLVVEMPGVKDVNEAISLIGKTAELDFKEQDTKQGFKSTGLTGKDFKAATVSFDQSNNPQIDIEFTAEGGKKFEQITGRNISKILAIFLDGQPISYPTVNQKISGGRGVITGKFDIKEAKNLAIQLNAGALPVPIKLIEQREVGATLGRESVNMSLYAGILGIIFVSLFMIAYYRMLGLFSTVGLGLYIAFMLALVKLFGITLTMGGIAGLILSVGMSMETDVLVFERLREELRKGKAFEVAVNLGFKNAWPSIKDSNAVSLIIAALLYTAGGTIRGFAVVLALGIIVGLTTTFLGTRTILNIAMRFKGTKKYWLYNVNKTEVEV
jgi:preprotein translocase subunit SecD